MGVLTFSPPLINLQVVSVEDPPVRQAGAKVEDVDALIGKLKDKGF